MALFPVTTDCLCLSLRFFVDTVSYTFPFLCCVLCCILAVKTEFEPVAAMTTQPPSYATAPPGESKGLYPSVGTDQQPQQPSVAYHAQPAGAPGYYYPQQQQQQQVYVTGPPASVMVAPAAPVKSYVAHIVVSCIVFWCCGCLCGLIAFIFASKSRRYSSVNFLYVYTVFQ